MAVIAAQFPHLVPLIFAKYDRDQCGDSLIREQLLQIARGTFRSQMVNGELLPIKYSLDDCCARHFGRRLNKEGFRLFYRAFDTTIDPTSWAYEAADFQARGRLGEWPGWVEAALRDGLITQKNIEDMLACAPDEPVRYALEDATTTKALYESQEKIAAQKPGVLADQFRQARGAFALHLSSCWGIYTNKEAVDWLEANLITERDTLQAELQTAGLVRADGTADTKVAMAAMEAACAEEGIPLAKTPGGKVSLGADACDRLDEDSLIGRYSRFLTVRKCLSNDVKMLRSGCDVPIQPRYGMADTGRTTCSGPNIQAINRGAGIREAFRPRPGMVFIQADFEGLELHTLAAWCLEVIGWSKLAEALNAKQDVHLAMAATMLGITYDEALVRKKAGDPEIKEMRQRAKAINFGYPGGLGVAKFVKYARSSYGVELTEAEASASKGAWLRMFPEMGEHFRLASVATANPDKEADDVSLFTGRHGGKVRYSALCNRRFQGLGADCAKAALWAVTRACYAVPASPLYGCRVVAFVHDEIIAECEEARASAAAKELGVVMCAAANVYLSKVPVRTAPQIMRVWSKAAEPVYNEAGDLIPWEPSEAA